MKEHLDALAVKIVQASYTLEEKAENAVFQVLRNYEGSHSPSCRRITGRLYEKRLQTMESKLSIIDDRLGELCDSLPAYRKEVQAFSQEYRSQVKRMDAVEAQLRERYDEIPVTALTALRAARNTTLWAHSRLKKDQQALRVQEKEFSHLVEEQEKLSKEYSTLFGEYEEFLAKNQNTTS